MSERIREHDWAGTLLGPLGEWPQPLKTLVAVMLGSNQPIFITWGTEQTLLYNDAYREILALKHPGALGRSFLDVWDEVRSDLIPTIEQGYAGQPVHMDDFELLMHRRGYPEETHFAFSYTPVRDDSGCVAGIFCSCTEITCQVLSERRRREAEVELRAERDRTRHLLDGMAEGFGLLDREFRVIDINAEGLRLEERPRETILGKIHWEAWPGSEDSELGRLLKRAMAERVPVSLEHRYVWADGHDAWLELRVYPTDDGLALFWRDVTERHRHQEALRAERDRSVEILESISDAFYAVDHDWRFTYVNRKAEEWWGRRADDLIGNVYWEEFPQAIGTETYRAHQRAMREGTPVRVETVSPILNHWVGLDIHPTAGGGLSVYFRDITEKMQVEEHQRLLINELNHRVKNTLATVQSITAQSLRNAGSPEEARAAIEARLIALSRAHDVLTRENWQGANLRQIVTQAIEPYSSDREERLHLRGPDIRLQPRTVLAIAMAIQELATNAVKYGALSNASGEVWIEWSLDASVVPQCLNLTWQESGGPLVRAPSQRGFGTRLIERSLAQELNGQVAIEFAPEGVRCNVAAPITDGKLAH
jgi:PAS domain S-box-containing protein